MLDKRFAVVDLETTGNDPHKDKIIDLSIVFVEGNKIVGDYNHLISDADDIPSFVTELTSITLEDIKSGVKFSDIKDEVYELLANCCFVAHNIEFDLNFLKIAFKEVGINFKPNLAIDTVELSKVFFPTLNSYQLGALSKSLNLTLDHAHRAYDDAKATAELLIKIINEIQRLDRQTMIRLYNISKSLDTNVSELLFASLSENNHKDASFLIKSLSLKEVKEQQQVKNHITIESLYENFLEMNQFKHRDDQIELIYTVYNSLKENKALALEAYTGLGKTEAILIASIAFSNETNQQILISTSKKILQEEMYYRSLKRLLKASNLNKLPIAMLKGKSNYINLNTMLKLLEFKDDNYEIIILKMKLLVWLTSTKTGDLGEVSLKGPEKLYYDTAHYQISDYDQYFYNRAVDHAKSSHICITNHYFMQECLTEMDSKYLIVDEAHQVLKAVNNQNETGYKYMDLKFLLSQIGVNNKDRILKDYLDHNHYEKKDYLISMLSQLNKTIDEAFTQLNHQNITRATTHFTHILNLIDIVLSSILNTENYESLYNYLNHFKLKIHDIVKHLKSNEYRLITDKNFQKTTLFVNNHSKELLYTELESLKGQLLISGTLEVNESFNHLDEWFNGEFEKKIIKNDNLFDNVDLFIPNDVHDLNDREAYIIDLVDYISMYYSIRQEKTIVLFTNYKLLNDVYQFIIESELFDFPILKQNKNDSANKLLLQYNQLQNCLLLATESFTEGINFENLNDRTIFLTKLPFPVPTGEGFRHFYKEDLPDAVFMFRQILGRIKRNENDSGRIVLFDNRLLNKTYKNAFLKYFEEENIIYDDRSAFNDMLTRL